MGLSLVTHDADRVLLCWPIVDRIGLLTYLVACLHLIQGVCFPFLFKQPYTNHAHSLSRGVSFYRGQSAFFTLA